MIPIRCGVSQELELVSRISSLDSVIVSVGPFFAAVGNNIVIDGSGIKVAVAVGRMVAWLASLVWAASVAARSLVGVLLTGGGCVAVAARKIYVLVAV